MCATRTTYITKPTLLYMPAWHEIRGLQEHADKDKTEEVNIVTKGRG